MSKSYETEFEHRLLYEQNAFIEEDKQVHTRTYACSYLYPGAVSRTTCRARITLVFDNQSSFGKFVVHGGTIEKWSDRGWMNLEEYFDTGSGMQTKEEVITHMLNMFKSFVLGVSTLEPKSFNPDSPPSPPRPPKDKNPKLRVLSFKDKVSNDYNKYIKDDKSDIYDKNNDKKDNDPPDFDWI